LFGGDPAVKSDLGVVVREDADDVGPPLDLLVDAFEWIC
jgi:hypothetical protein